MVKRQFKVRELETKHFSLGDKVKLIDGSSLTCYDQSRDVYIIHAYKDITGLNEILKYCTAEVIHNNISDLFAEGILGFIYKQDVCIKIGEGIFYTSSAHIVSVEEN